MPLLVVAVAWAAHGGVLANGWVWDDAIVIRDGAVGSGGLTSIPPLLTAPWAGEAHDVGLFRPLVSISLAVQGAISGTGDAFPFHIVNLFLHASVAMALLAVLRRVFPTRPVLVSAATLAFAAHPLHAGTVSWIVARGDLLAALFLLLGVLVWTRERTTSIPAALVTGLLWFAALLAKEAAVTFPLALLVLDAVVRGVRPLKALRAHRLGYAMLVLPFAAWLVLRVSAVGGIDATAANAALAGRNGLERFLIGAGALVRTAGKLFVPAGLCGDGSGDPVLRARSAIPFGYAAAGCVVVLVSSIAVVAGLVRRAGPVMVAILLFVVLSFPVLQIVPIGAVFEDRFAYLPSVALIVLPGMLAERVILGVRPRAVGVAVAVVALGALALASWRVAADWRDESSFNRALLADDPGHIRALDRLAHELTVRARAAAVRAAASPIRNDADRAQTKALHAHGEALASEAVELLERARSLPSGARDPSVLAGLGDAYLALPIRRSASALGVYRDLLALKRVRVGGRRVPLDRVEDLTQVSRRDRRDLAKIHHNIAIARTGVDENGAAALSHEEAARWLPAGDPEEYAYLRAAGVAVWRSLGDPRRALPYLERAARLAPPEERVRAAADAREAREARGRADVAFEQGAAALERQDAQVDALRFFEEAIEIDPDFSAAHIGVARVRRWKGDFRGALDALDAADAALDRRKKVLSREPDAALRAEIATVRARVLRERDEEPGAKDR